MLKRVTITGADDNTPISWLLEMSERFPFVEWAILVSKRREGGSRFPSRQWCNKFSRQIANIGMADRPLWVKVSMHICGQWVRDFLHGELRWDDLPEVRVVADRVQINTHAEEQVSTAAMFDFIRVYGMKEFIFQLDGVNDHLFDAAAYRRLNVSGLFDCSHGAGVLPKEWPWISDKRIYGYAGGLGPENVVEQIGIINSQRTGPGLPATPFWIDMEGRVRDGVGRLDLKKVERVLMACESLIEA